MATVTITGGTGLIGKHLSQHLLKKGYKVVILSRARHQGNDAAAIRYLQWDIDKSAVDAGAISAADHIIHLAGANVTEKRWTAKRKQELLDSRTKSSELIVKALKEIPNNVKTVVTASAIGWYGWDTKTSRQKGFTEDAPADHHFLGDTCRLWEESVKPVEASGKRLVKLRTGIVLAKDEGALKEFMKPVKRGVAPIFSSGSQMMSWIHIDDLCRMYIAAIENEKMAGTYNAVSPQPLTNKEMMLTLAKKIRGRFFIPVHIPAFILKIMLGELSVEVLKSATVSSNKIRREGFTFLYPSLSSALDDLLKK